MFPISINAGACSPQKACSNGGASLDPGMFEVPSFSTTLHCIPPQETPRALGFWIQKSGTKKEMTTGQGDQVPYKQAVKLSLDGGVTSFHNKSMGPETQAKVSQLSTLPPATNTCLQR